ncbi:MAG: hypothetical protein K6G25_10370 [Bacteroidales bacterium]|nr:hypothetical protein [Bacteroidales bacterium]
MAFFYTDCLYSIGERLVSCLVIDEGALLVNRSENVKATTQKSISAYTGEKNNYYLIASPVDKFTPGSNMLSNNILPMSKK